MYAPVQGNARAKKAEWSCYTATFRRYQDYGDKMESVCEDVDLLKKVVMSHSEKLQKLA